MKKTTFLVLLILVVLASLAGWWVTRRDRATWQTDTVAQGQKLFPALPINDIARVVVKSKNDQVVLERLAGKWTVTSANGYPADFAKLGDFLRELVELAPAQVIEAGEQELGRLQLNPPEAASDTANVVQFFTTGDKPVATLRLGKEHLRQADEQAAMSPFGGGGAWPNGRFVMDEASGTVALVDKTFSTVTDRANDWLDKTFLRVSKAKQVSGLEGDQEVWTLSRDSEAGSFVLAGEWSTAEEPNTSKISSVSSALSYPSFQRVVKRTPEAEQEHGLGEPARLYRATTFDGFTYTLRLGKKTEQGELPVIINVTYLAPPAPAAPENETPEAKEQREKKQAEDAKAATTRYEQEQTLFPQWIYFLPGYSGDNLLVSRADLLSKKAPPATPPAEGAAPAQPPLSIPLPPAAP
jgi:hypothetical protein